MKNLFTCAFFCFLFSQLAANTPHYLEIELDWSDPVQRIQLGETQMERLHHRGAFYPEEQPLLPLIIRTYPTDGPGQPTVRILEVEYVDINWILPDNLDVSEQLEFSTNVEKDRSQYFAKLAFIPLIKRGQKVQAVKKIRLEIQQRETGPRLQTRSAVFKNESVLRDGSIYKMAITEAGIYKLSYDFLRTELGIDIDNASAENIQIYSNRGGIVPEIPDSNPLDDLEELPILVSDGGDGRINNGDFIIFYTEGPDAWSYNSNTEDFEFEKNIYDDENFIFLKIGNQAGRRISQTPAASSSTTAFTSFDDYIHYEEDKVNLHYFWGETLGKAQGSGKDWFGDHFRNLRTYNYDGIFNFPNLLTDQPVRVEARMALRAVQRSTFNLSIGGQNLVSTRANRIAVLSGRNDNINNYANAASLQEEVLVNNDNLSISVDYPFPQSSSDGSEAWLDYIEITAERALRMEGAQMAFRKIESSTSTQPTYRIQNAGTNHLIWEITNPLLPRQYETNAEGNELVLRTRNDLGTVQQFIAFDPNQVTKAPMAVGQIENQNLHALQDIDMLILTNEDLFSIAEDLARHRTTFSGLRVAVVNVEEVYNEFSSGRREPAAIRDMARMLYSRDSDFRYLLLFGDGSFDHKDFYGLGNNIIPTYQQDSFNPLYAFPADDFFGILEEGQSAPLRGILNISVGRLPVRDQQEANQVVNKVKLYDNNPKGFQDWRNRLVFVADDEDSNVHINDADDIAEEVSDNFRAYNLDKIYLDAFPQVSTPGGNRFPAVTQALNEAIFKGSLIVTYLGHGGSEGWAQERILNISNILSWDNLDQMPLLMTATCSFTGYDDPTFTSAGEESLLNPRGGAFALMTTTRAVFANQNAALTEIALDRIFSKTDGQFPTLGEAMLQAKNIFTSNSSNINSRKFTLIGDPSQKLAIPEYQIETTNINETAITGGQLDTLSSLEKVKVSGIITDNTGQKLEDFNGIIYPTVFDKELTLKTLGQDQGSRIKDYNLQKNIIFKGRASVVNGAFEFTFIVPRDINYALGPGKISYYASDQNTLIDANGSYEQIIIGGSNENAITDTQGPNIEVFMNTEDFVFGGITDANPTLLVKLEDDLGINVVGNSIGHDLEGTLDEDTQNTILLNDFFQSDLDDFTKGEVRFPLNDLSEGVHTIRVKAWDVANNSAEGYTEFLVANSEGFILEHVLNYPNPFTDRTCFQFDHNYANQDLDVLIQVFTVSGRLVKTLEANIFSDGAIRQDDCIEWDGRDDFGDPLARGVYLYKVKVRANIPGTNAIKGESEFQKLVLLK